MPATKERLDEREAGTLADVIRRCLEAESENGSPTESAHLDGFDTALEVSPVANERALDERALQP